MDNTEKEALWNRIPIGKKNAISYAMLCDLLHKDIRTVRKMLHDLSAWDNGDDLVLIRSGKAKGFYRTDDKDEISAYRKECLNKGRSTFAPVKKCNRILKTDVNQLEILNNLRAGREWCGMKQKEVCDIMRDTEKGFDESLLSKMENGVCLPTLTQLAKLSQIYGIEASELIRTDLFGETNIT